MPYLVEQEFFHRIANKLFTEARQNRSTTKVAEKKRFGDFSTQVDIDTEKYIVSELNKYFPSDQILAEESYSDHVDFSPRTWVIDPICGTTNLAKDINFYCTNVALIEDNDVVAACVVDYSQNDYFWSTGNGIYINKELYKSVARPGVKIDVDLGAVTLKSTDLSLFEQHLELMRKIYNQTDYEMVSFNTSLGFAYVAVGKIDAVVNIFSKPWDVCAASFLIQQSGGVITALDGEKWTPRTSGLITARNADLHSQLLDLFKAA